MATTSTYQSTISPTDALWALYQSQSKKVRKAFRMRILSEEQELITKTQQKMVRESLTTAFDELHAGKAKHDARSLFAK
jgi:hypothetical protein